MDFESKLCFHFTWPLIITVNIACETCAFHYISEDKHYRTPLSFHLKFTYLFLPFALIIQTLKVTSPPLIRPPPSPDH
jgi:hypothetical protein